MARVSRRSVLFGLGVGAAVTGLGCGGMNPFLLPYFFDHDTKIPAEYTLKPNPRKSDAKVVVFVSAKMGMSPDLAGVDRMLNSELIAAMEANIKANEEKVQILKMPKIDEYKSQNPNWKTIHPVEMGRTVAEGTDYVIDVEILDMDLFKPGSRGQWLLGRATVSVSAYDLGKPVKDPAYKQELPFTFPREGEVEKESPAQLSAFRMRFVQYIAGEVAAKFTSTSSQRNQMANTTWSHP